MSQTEPRPYVSIYVAIDTPDAPRLGGKPVRSVSWSARRFGREGAPVEFVITAHHGDGDLTTMLETQSQANPDLPAWVPRPPSGWLASLRMTAEPEPEPSLYPPIPGACTCEHLDDLTVVAFRLDCPIHGRAADAALLRTYGRAF